MNEIDTERAFAPIDDVMEVLTSLPGIDDDREEREARQEQAEREYRVGLATIRQVAALTQTEVAQKMGVGQTSVSRLEARPDMLLSTMKAYFDAVGAEAVITIRVAGVEHRARLDELVEGKPGRAHQLVQPIVRRRDGRGTGP